MGILYKKGAVKIFDKISKTVEEIRYHKRHSTTAAMKKRRIYIDQAWLSPPITPSVPPQTSMLPHAIPRRSYWPSD